MLKCKGKCFEKNKRLGKAEVVGYERADQSNWYTLLVRIPELNDGKIYSCSAGKTVISRFPKNSVVDILYAPRHTLGMNYVEVHLLENPPADSSKLGCGLKRIAIAVFIIAVVIAIAGVITLLQ